MILQSRTSEDHFRPRGGRWSLWRFHRENITPERKLEHVLLTSGKERVWHWPLLALAIVWLFWRAALI